MAHTSMFSDMVKINYIPLPHEVNQIRTVILEEKRQVTLIEEEMEQLRQRLDGLDRQRSSHMEKIEDYSALLSPFRALPVEILGNISLACLDTYVEDPPSSRLGKHPAHLLGQVCRLWREVVLGTSRMWSVIDISLPIHPAHVLEKRYRMALDLLPKQKQDAWKKRTEDWERRIHSIHEMLELYLARSADQPLTISFSAKRTHPSPTDDDGCALRPIVDTLLSAYQRVEEVTFKIKLEFPSCPLRGLLMTSHNAIPLLRRARLDIKLGSLAEDEALNTRILWFMGPRLTSIDLNMRWYFVRIMAEGINWSALTDLSLCTIERDDILTPDILSVMQTLSSCPRLLRCALEIEHDDHTTLPDPQSTLYPIFLPHLRHLTIYGHGVHNFMSMALNLPSLEDLHTLKPRHNPYNGEEEGIPDGILPWAKKYGSQLKYVSFEYGYLSQPQLLASLAFLEAVVSLNLNGEVDYSQAMPEEDVDEEDRAHWALPARLSDDVLQTLVPPVGCPATPLTSPCFCPKLRRMECTTGDLDFNERGFLELIASRRMVAKESESGISQLEEVVLVFNTPKTMDLRSELESRGVDVDAFGLKVKYANEG